VFTKGLAPTAEVDRENHYFALRSPTVMVDIAQAPEACQRRTAIPALTLRLPTTPGYTVAPHAATSIKDGLRERDPRRSARRHRRV
jgi:hypothetical protein